MTLPNALITGANRGIGRAIAEKLAATHHILLGSRSAESAQVVVDAIRERGGSAEAVVIDVGDSASIQQAAKAVGEKHRTVDVLVNNAGIMVGFADEILSASREDIEQALAINAFGPLDVTRAFLPLLKAAPHGRVINISSTIGAVSDMVDVDSPYGASAAAPYRLSKNMLNGVTGLLARELRPNGIAVNAICPGWVQTDMGGAEALRTTAEAAADVAQLALSSDKALTGQFYANGEPRAW